MEESEEKRGLRWKGWHGLPGSKILCQNWSLDGGYSMA